jgi:CHAT domain-containing protein/tetratricopeptide (TPR) repeat protein
MKKLLLAKIQNEPSSMKNQIMQLSQKGENMRLQEKPEEAIIYLNRARELNADLGDQLLEAMILEGLGHCYQLSGVYELAIKTANDAICIFKQMPGWVGQLGNANSLICLGNIYTKLGKYKEAIANQEKAIEIYLGLRAKHYLGIAYCHMGEAHSQIGENKKAINLFHEAYNISLSTGDKFEQARSLHNIGNAYNGMEEFKNAINYCEESARIFTEIGSKKGASLSYGVLAGSHLYLRKTDTSERYYNFCIDINRDMKQFSDLSVAYGNKGILYYSMALPIFLSSSDAKESLERCIETFKMAMESADKVLTNLSVDSNRTAFTDRFYQWYDHITAPFNLLGRSTAALLFLDLGRAKILRYLVYNKQLEDEEDDEVKSGFESSLLTIENGEEKHRISALSRDIKLYESNATVLFYNFNHAQILTIWVLDANGCVSLKTSEPSGKFTTSRQELEEHIKILLEKASLGFPRGYSFFKEPEPNVKPLSSNQQQNEENSEKVTSHKEVVVIDNTDKYRSPGKRADKSYEDFSKDSRSLLHRSLIDPVKNMINGTKLIIVPQRCLFFTPFSSLIDENGCLLSERYEIQIIPSVHVLAISMHASRSTQIGGSLFVGNPQVKNFHLPSLPSAEEEVEYLASLLDAKPLTGRMATKRKVVDLMSTASMIHIAAHGHQQTGHIFLAPDTGNPNEGFRPALSTNLLTQNDVLKCKLSARLVVLSCCNTGKGELSSEGVLGIARSFLGAGAQSILVTLWNIDDIFTKEFMKVFYEKIFEEKSVCFALKETMNQFQRSGHFTSFLFWAAFEILGEDVRFTKSELEQIRRKNQDILCH